MSGCFLGLLLGLHRPLNCFDTAMYSGVYFSSPLRHATFLDRHFLSLYPLALSRLQYAIRGTFWCS